MSADLSIIAGAGSRFEIDLLIESHSVTHTAIYSASLVLNFDKTTLHGFEVFQ